MLLRCTSTLPIILGYHLMNLPYCHHSMKYFNQSIRNMSNNFLSLTGFFRANRNSMFTLPVLKVHKCRFENLPLCSWLDKNNTRKTLYYESYEFSSYSPVKFSKCLFTNIQKQYNMLKSSLLFEKNTNFTSN